MSTKKFTPEEVSLLMKNPNIINATSNKLTYSPAFKQKAIASVRMGMTSTEFFASEGLDSNLLGKPRIYAAMKSFKREAATIEDLREVRTDALTEKQAQATLRKLGKKVKHLEQQLEYLKELHNTLRK